MKPDSVDIIRAKEKAINDFSVTMKYRLDKHFYAKEYFDKFVNWMLLIITGSFLFIIDKRVFFFGVIGKKGVFIIMTLFGVSMICFAFYKGLELMKHIFINDAIDKFKNESLLNGIDNTLIEKVINDFAEKYNVLIKFKAGKFFIVGFVIFMLTFMILVFVSIFAFINIK